MAIINGTDFNDNNTVQFNGTFFEFFPQLDGTNADDTIFGFNGTDILNGGVGADNMDGGDQDDIYIVDNLGDEAAEFFDDALAGVDTVNSSVTHRLGFGIENLNLTGGGAINGTGNGKNNSINGNPAANVIDGSGGADTMNAGDGSDTYFVDNLGDIAEESFDDPAGGVDIVHSTVTHSLRFGIENLNLTGGGAIDGTGNALNNIIDGTAAVNRMDGGSGNDTLLGFGGNDTLTGGVGRDILNGGTGFDTFRYTAIGESTVGANHDTIAGFNGVGAAAQDRVNINAIDANTTAPGNQNFIFGGPFTIGHIRVINSGGNSLIQGNVDADPAAEFEILVQDGPAVAANWVAGDFFL